MIMNCFLKEFNFLFTNHDGNDARGIKKKRPENKWHCSSAFLDTCE